MTRLLLGLALLVSVLMFGCTKPSGADCRKAIGNMQLLMGTEHLAHDSDIEGEVRRCRGGSKKKAVQCAIAATSLDELRGCDFMHVPAKLGSGSAAMGSGSAATGSGTGSGAASGSGAATGSGAAATGSGTVTGSDPGSATGSPGAGSSTH